MNGRLLELIADLLDGSLEEEARGELNALLLADAEARRFYREHMELHARLHLAYSGGGLSEAMPDRLSPAGKSNRRRTRNLPFLAWAGIAAALVFALLAWLRPFDSGDVGIASLIRSEGNGNGNGFAPGHVFAKGDRLSIEEGLVEMAFRDTGVHLIGAAPLSLTLTGKDRLFLHEGEVKLVVPPQGVGFTVETFERSFTDLGTSFVVTANSEGSKVLVLDGEIAVGERNDNPEHLMAEGELAKFDRNGEMKLRTSRHSGVPELSLPTMNLTARSLPGITVGHEGLPTIPKIGPHGDVIGRQLVPLIQSGFRDRTCLNELKRGAPLRFTGIAGSYSQFPDGVGLSPYKREYGWLAWYHGNVAPPQSGRYRFWGYADNHLLVAIDGRPVFEGSRRDSPFRNDLNVPRTNHPSLPCLNSEAGFASGPWMELDGSPVQLDILFGEIDGNRTSGLLLVEREGDAYEETYWGQPKWPLLLTEVPGEVEITELEGLRRHLEDKLMGSFSISNDAFWKVPASN